MKPVKPGVFRTYDIRGVVDKDFDPQWAEKLGRACGTYFQERGFSRAVVGRDCRHSSPAYMEAVTRGLTASGVDVVILGLVSTPLFYFAVKRLTTHAGVMVTASHNPPEYNGFKVWAGEGTIYSEEIRKLYEIMASGKFASGRAMASVHDMAPAYLEELSAMVPITRPVKLVVDGGNGSGGELTARLLELAGCEVERLFCEPDGDFPNHHPDPTIEANMAALKAKVAETKAEAGIGLDGDCDRIGVVDESGRLLYGDELTGILARGLLAEKPGAKIIADVKCSHRLFNDIEARGGTAIMSPTGHSLIKARMIEEQADMAGEMSGHIFYAQRFFGFDDASYAALRLAEIMAARPGEPLSEYLADWPESHSTPEMRIECPEEAKAKVVARAVAELGRDHEAVTIDGIRVLYPDGWALIRASNTQPVLVMRAEAESAERLDEIRGDVEGRLRGWIKEYS